MIKIDDRALWGNEAADDEDPSVLSSYFVKHPEHDNFFDDDVPLVIARARKGMGKSALINEFASELSAKGRDFVLNLKGADLVAQKPVVDMRTDEKIYDWQQRICMCINREIGSRLKFAVNDDEILLVENSELMGYKRRNLLGSLIDRFKGKIGPLALEKIAAVDHSKLLERVVDDNEWCVYVLIDDIDATFLNSESEIYRLSTFFTACREMIRNHKGVYIRATVRSDVWASIRRRDEALDKVEQYIFDIYWSNADIGKMLASRISSYEKRIGSYEQPTPRSVSPERLRLIALGVIKPAAEEDSMEPALPAVKWRHELQKVFAEKFPWGASTAYNYRIIHTYAGGRPRWALQLCRMAAHEAVKVNDTVIKFGHIRQVLKEYGRFRLDDITREHIHQCPTIGQIVNSFSNQSPSYTTDQLVNFVKKAIISNMKVTIDGEEIVDPMAICRFLFRVGFLLGKTRVARKTLVYYTFEEKPELFRNLSNIDDGLSWIVHPSFQAALSAK